MAALVGSACHSVFFSQFVLLAAFVQGCVGFGCCRIPVLFRFIDDRRNIYSDQFKSVIQAMGDEAGRPPNKPLPVWARPTSGPKPTEFTEPGPRIAVVVRSIWESMCQVPEGLKQKAARRSLEGGSAEEEVGWVGDRLVQPLICPGMPGQAPAGGLQIARTLDFVVAWTFEHDPRLRSLLRLPEIGAPKAVVIRHWLPWPIRLPLPPPAETRLA